MKNMFTFIFVVFISACASQDKPIAKTYAPDLRDYQTPNMDATLSDYRTVKVVHPVSVMSYEESVARINKEFTNENLKLEMCASVYGKDSKECTELRKSFCDIDMHIDANGGRHIKPYCPQ